MLDDAGYKDTDGDGVREMPDGGQPLKFRYAVRSRQRHGRADPRAHHRLAEEDRHRTEVSRSTTDSQLTDVIGKGDYDMFVWGWTPFVDPDPMLCYFTCAQVTTDPKDPSDLQRRQLVRPAVRRAVRAAEGRARPGEAQWIWCTRC